MSEGHESRVERFRVLYDDAYPRVMAYALRRARTREDALDVVAETMLVVWRRLDQIPTDRRRLPWVFGVARRVLANQYRAVPRRDRLVTRVAHEPDSAAPEFDAVHEALERLAALDPREARIIELRIFAGSTVEETAEVLGRPGQRRDRRGARHYPGGSGGAAAPGPRPPGPGVGPARGGRGRREVAAIRREVPDT